MAARSWMINTPLGHFRLEAAPARGRLASGKVHAHARRVWFFAQRQLLHLVPEALEAALMLRSELGGLIPGYTPGKMDGPAAERLARELEQALLSGRLILTRRPALQIFGVPGSTASEAPWIPPSEQSSPVAESTWIEVELSNQQGEPVAYRPFRVLQQGRVMREAMTNDTGFARVELLAPGPCEVEFLDLDEADFQHQPALAGSAPAEPAGPVTRAAAEA